MTELQLISWKQITKLTDRMFHTGIYYNVPCYIIQSGSVFNKNKYWRRKWYFFKFYCKLDIMQITFATDDLLIKLVKWSQNSLRWVRVQTISSQKVARSAASWRAHTQDKGWGGSTKIREQEHWVADSGGCLCQRYQSMNTKLLFFFGGGGGTRCVGWGVVRFSHSNCIYRVTDFLCKCRQKFSQKWICFHHYCKL